jgi:benzoylsuccinyl-CoA thiolase BbsB subunit
MREVYVLGIGEIPFGRFKGVSAIKMGVDAAKAAIKDADIDPRDIQVCYGSRTNNDTQTIEDIMQYIGVVEREMHNVENACAAGGSAVNLCYKDIASGLYDVGIVVGCESMTSMGPGLIGVADGDLDGALGVTMPAHGAMLGRRFLEVRGGTLEDFAYPSVKNHRNAVHNPYAMFRKAVTTEDVLNARMIADPVTVLHCCPTSDGAAAVILCSAEYAKKHTTKLIRMNSSVVMSAPYERFDLDMNDAYMIHRLSYLAYDKAGIGPDDLDMVELHDAFAPEELYAYEATGVCPEGECLKFIHDGLAEIGGKCAFSPSGGLQSFGHPLAASGVRVVCEITRQLRGGCGEGQVPNAHCGMAQMIGGYLTTLGSPTIGACHILTN